MIELKLFLLLLNERDFFPIADNSRVRTILLFSASRNQRVFSFSTVSALFVKTVQRRWMVKGYQIVTRGELSMDAIQSKTEIKGKRLNRSADFKH